MVQIQYVRWNVDKSGSVEDGQSIELNAFNVRLSFISRPKIAYFPNITFGRRTPMFNVWWPLIYNFFRTLS